MASGKNTLMNKQHYKNQTTKTYHNASNATKNLHSNKPNASKFAL